jgi:hypothetical protein
MRVRQGRSVSGGRDKSFGGRYLAEHIADGTISFEQEDTGNPATEVVVAYVG